MRPPLVRQLLYRTVISAALAVVAAIALLAWQFEHSAEIVHDRGLQAMADSIAAAITIGDDGMPIGDFSEEFRSQFSDEYFFTVSMDDHIAILSVPDGHDHVYHPFEPEIVDHPQYFSHTYLGENENYLGLTTPLDIGGQRYWVQVVEEVPARSNLINYSVEVFLKGAGVVLVLFVIAIVLIVHFTVKEVFRPVSSVAAQAREITSNRSNARLETAELPAEVVPLADAANSALERLDRALVAQRRFTADAAHELLTPLTVLKSQLEVGRGTDDRQSLRNEVDDLIDIVQQLLELSELEAERGPPSTAVDLREISADVIAMMAREAIAAGREIELTGSDGPVMVYGCQRALQRAIRNLVENAIRHATGATRISVDVQADGRVRVIDDGAGIPKALHESIFERFQRGERDPQRGSGLGLAIAKQIAESHDGRISIQDPPSGRGAMFVLEIPSVADR